MAYNNDRDELINLINILSFMIGLENMNENRIQSAQNDVQMANDKQVKYLLEEINRRFDEQNEILRSIQKELDKMLQSGKIPPCTEQEQQDITEQAKANNMSLASYIRYLVAKERKERDK